jgi:alcohol dehydrogenase class IV
MNFEFSTATKIIFGTGSISKVGLRAGEMGRRALVAFGVPGGMMSDFSNSLMNTGLEVVPIPVDDEPGTGKVMEGVVIARKEKCDVVIGIGGGSAIDTAKAIAVLLTNPGDLYDYLEVIGRGQPIREASAPLISIPTTAGTGAEVTSNAVLSAEVPESRGRKIKVSLRSPLMVSRLAIIDPELTLGLPPQITASTGLDALVQLIEPFVSNRANPLTDALCRDGLIRAARSLREVYDNGENLTAREDMALASLFSGLALANAKLGAVHGFAAPIGGRFSAPHGAICARLLPLVMQMNFSALQTRQPSSPVLERYTEIAQILTGNPKETIEGGLQWIRGLVEDLHVPPLRVYGLSEEDIPELVDEAARASSMQGNPIKLTEAELGDILRLAM